MGQGGGRKEEGGGRREEGGGRREEGGGRREEGGGRRGGSKQATCATRISDFATKQEENKKEN
jgi:hypothetical protein